MSFSARPVRLPQRFFKNLHVKGDTPAFTDGSVRRRPHPSTSTGPDSDSRHLKSQPRSTDGPLPCSRASMTRNTLFLTLPLPPSINKQYATVNGRRVLSATGRRYKRTIGQFVMTTVAAHSSQGRAFLLAAHDHYLSLTIHFYFSTLLRRDLDGGLKIAQDALCEAMRLNDNRILELHLYKSFDRDHPRLECALTLTTPHCSSRRTRSAAPASSPLR